MNIKCQQSCQSSISIRKTKHKLLVKKRSFLSAKEKKSLVKEFIFSFNTEQYCSGIEIIEHEQFRWFS